MILILIPLGGKWDQKKQKARRGGKRKSEEGPVSRRDGHQGEEEKKLVRGAEINQGGEDLDQGGKEVRKGRGTKVSGEREGGNGGAFGLKEKIKRK